MLLEGFYHIAQNNWAYAYDKDTIHVRVRTKRDDVEEVTAETGDKYNWDRFYREYPLKKTGADKMFDYWEASIKPYNKRVSYCFRIRAGSETVWLTENGVLSYRPMPTGGYYDIPYIHEIDLHTVPEWAKRAVFYQIFPERFANGDPSINPAHTERWGGKPTYDISFGGDLQGIIDHLDYLQDLGITALYLTPVFEAPSNHKYDIVDYKKVDPHFGTNALLHELVQACHLKGIKVMLDAVFNHCSEQFPPFQDVLKKGRKSQYAGWFHINSYPLATKDGIPSYDTFGFYGHMPKLNTSNPAVKKYLLEVAEYWVKEVGIDGWRLDVANEIDHYFWREFRDVVKAANPNAYIVGEVWNDSLKWLLGDQFDSVMNYPFSNKLLEFFSDSRMDGFDFATSISGLLIRYPQQTNEVIFNLLCSHDTPRVMNRVGNNKRRLKLCVVFLLTFMGTPCIFYGDEIGLTGGEDPDCRKCMEWDEDKQDRELFDFYKLLIALRRKHEVLVSGSFRFLRAEHGDRRIIYERLNHRVHFTVWMNNTGDKTILSHPMETNDWVDALTGEPVRTKDGRMFIQLEEFGYRILYRSLQ
ncbi:alpha-glycosidase [Paenibacillus sp. WQ 127069]|uniref:Alpha-glycosidase n=1 Tax=Paenibacillus baimaensis TaxID=2982185 RepID=A0ABT2UR49_9BACL|nr:alpha-glycosidase [Paenibacillus sp. WQ 127069]MCU6797138.1 alpha-glycosidase [Paenibacillus sp. WQ 127069]